jgi:hypothetical protein
MYILSRQMNEYEGKKMKGKERMYNREEYNKRLTPPQSHAYSSSCSYN